VLQGQADLLIQAKKECQEYIRQVHIYIVLRVKTLDAVFFFKYNIFVYNNFIVYYLLQNNNNDSYLFVRSTFL